MATFGSFVTGQVLTAAELNARVGCELRNSGDQTITTATKTVVTFDTEMVDTNGFHSTVTNTSRITIPSGFAGIYVVAAHIRTGATGWPAGSVMGIQKNGDPVIRSIAFADVAFTSLSTCWVGPVVATDYLEMYVYQSSGGNRTVSGVTAGTLDPFSPYLSAWHLAGNS